MSERSQEAASVYERLCRWFAESGLYESISLLLDEMPDLLTRINNMQGLRVDCYCKVCREASVFTSSPSPVELQEVVSRLAVSDTHSLIAWANRHLLDLTFSCARDRSHRMRTICLSEWVGVKGISAIKLTTIGQYPSKLDLLQGALTRYSKVAEEADLRELRSAALCHSHGLHVAAFAYLRRVFERRLEVAHALARKDTTWKEDAYDPRAMRMDDRISALAQHLPRFLVENRVVYKILSKGIHELKENECEAAYTIVDEAIGLILDEELERRDRSVRIERARAALGSLITDQGRE